MHVTSDRNVVITENGRSGSLTYCEPAGSLAFYWEFGGGDVITIIQVHDPAWKAQPDWLIGRQAEILHFVADEVIRRKAPGCRAEINQATGEILLDRILIGTRVLELIHAEGERTSFRFVKEQVGIP